MINRLLFFDYQKRALVGEDDREVAEEDENGSIFWVKSGHRLNPVEDHAMRPQLMRLRGP